MVYKTQQLADKTANDNLCKRNMNSEMIDVCVAARCKTDLYVDLLLLHYRLNNLPQLLWK